MHHVRFREVDFQVRSCPGLTLQRRGARRRDEAAGAAVALDGMRMNVGVSGNRSRGKEVEPQRF